MWLQPGEPGRTREYQGVARDRPPSGAVFSHPCRRVDDPAEGRIRARVCAATAERLRPARVDSRAVALIHTCYRITDIDRSIAFYEALGFTESGRIPIRDEAINVFMNQPGDGEAPRLELTYNFGVDSYEIGTGYGHIAITTDDIDAALARLAEQGIEPERPPYTIREGGNRLTFVKDPDGYRVEILEMPTPERTRA